MRSSLRHPFLGSDRRSREYAADLGSRTLGGDSPGRPRPPGTPEVAVALDAARLSGGAPAPGRVLRAGCLVVDPRRARRAVAEAAGDRSDRAAWRPGHR